MERCSPSARAAVERRRKEGMGRVPGLLKTSAKGWWRDMVFAQKFEVWIFGGTC